MTSPREGAFPALAEGLPPCVKGVAVFDGRQVTWHDDGECPVTQYRNHHVCYGVAGPGRGEDEIHPPMSVILNGSGECLIIDDPDEAQAAFDKGAEYVRTGQLGEAT